MKRRIVHSPVHRVVRSPMYSALGEGVGVPRFIFLGASITNAALFDVPAFKTAVDGTYGSNVTIHNEAVDGWTSTDLKNGVDAICTSYTTEIFYSLIG